MTKRESTKRNRHITVTSSSRDQKYLDTMVAALKRARPKTNKSELMALGIALLQRKSVTEIEALLQDHE